MKILKGSYAHKLKQFDHMMLLATVYICMHTCVCMCVCKLVGVCIVSFIAM